MVDKDLPHKSRRYSEKVSPAVIAGLMTSYKAQVGFMSTQWRHLRLSEGKLTALEPARVRPLSEAAW